MNYRNENATPRDRYANTVISHNARSGSSTRSTAGCGCSSGTRVAENSCGCSYDSDNTARSSERANDTLHYHSSSERMSRSNCGCSRNYTRDSRNVIQRNICGQDNGHLHRDTPIAMVYSPMQQWRDLYDPCTALSIGTIFKELDLPFYPTSCRRKENSSCQCR